IEVSLRGKGGGPKIVVVPDHVDFGMVASQMTVTAHVLVSNNGTDASLNISAASITGDPADFAVAGFNQGISLLPGTGSLALTLTFHPPSAGDYQAALHLSSDDLDNPELDVPLTGQARDLPPCTWLATPPAITFGTVGQGSLAMLSTRVTNAGG